uniref:Large ribosomal subunit protein bL35m n=1 Tax=Callorhinchus milii TaxID=7868 RepID=A0A4W3IJJ3_CALMI
MFKKARVQLAWGENITLKNSCLSVADFSLPSSTPHNLLIVLHYVSLVYKFCTVLMLTPFSSIYSGSPPIPRFQQSVRTLTYFGLRRGKRKTVKAVVKRFLRLHCGLWVRRKAGYKKKLWKKSADRKRRLRQHVFCNRTQSKLLDKMTTDFWKRRNWYVNDPYQMYHDRTNLKV